MRKYKYIGSAEILKALDSNVIRAKVESSNTIEQWIKETNQEVDSQNFITATYIIDLEEWMWICDRHGEHIACAKGKDVLAAGEIIFSYESKNLSIESITNQSTGFCPDISCWEAVTAALHRAKLLHPEGFEPEFEFRRCTSCKNINVVKDNYYYCMVCGTELSEFWNIH